MLPGLKRFYAKIRSQGSFRHDAEEGQPAQTPIPPDLDAVGRQIGDTIGNSSDLVMRRIPVDGGPAVLIVSIDGLCDKNLLDRDVVGQLMAYHPAQGAQSSFPSCLKDKLLRICSIKETADFGTAVIAALSGNAVLFTAGATNAFLLGIRKSEKRTPSEPRTSTVLRGPREGFVESIQVNQSLIRRKIVNPALRFEPFTIGEQTKTRVELCYLCNVANGQIVDEVRRRISDIKTDSILESAYIESFLEDAPFSLFETVGNTERPDTAASKILEGRVAILCDGTPFVLTLPHLFVENLQAGDDYYSRPAVSFFGKMIRILGFWLTLYLPALYVSFTCFNQGAIPFKLLVTIYSAHANIPTGVFVSCLFVLFLFAVIKETASLLPRPVAQSISVVGGIVVGQAVVMAGFVSIPTVIVIAITVLTGYGIPELDRPISIVRLLLLIGANVAGNFGIIFISVVFLAYVCSLKSVGIPYLSPIAPLCGYDLKDVFFSFPVWAVFRKPETITRKFIEDQRKSGGTRKK